MPDAIKALADHCVGTGHDDLPAAALDAAKVCILDTLGVGLAGSTGPYVPELLRGNAAGGTASRVLAQSQRLPPAGAALLNAYQIHNSEFRLRARGGGVSTPSPSCSRPPLPMPTGAEGFPAEHCCARVILGVDIASSLGVASISGLRFFRPGTAGAFGAVASLGVLRGYDRSTLLRAFGLVYAQLCGTMQAHTEGSPLLALQIGFNARNAILACDLAEEGLPGLEGVLEGPFGYFGMIEAEGDHRCRAPPTLAGPGGFARLR